MRIIWGSTAPLTIGSVIPGPVPALNLEVVKAISREDARGGSGKEPPKHWTYLYECAAVSAKGVYRGQP